MGEMNPDRGARLLGDDWGRDETNEGMGQEQHDGSKSEGTQYHPPPASQVTAHEVVGGWNDNGEGRQEGGQARGKGDNDTGPMKHPQQLPRAIACGVKRGAT